MSKSWKIFFSLTLTLVVIQCFLVAPPGERLWLLAAITVVGLLVAGLGIMTTAILHKTMDSTSTKLDQLDRKYEFKHKASKVARWTFICTGIVLFLWFASQGDPDPDYVPRPSRR